MLYVAPSHEILSQVKMHIVKKVIFNIPNLEEMTIDEINELIRNDYDSIVDFNGINYGVDANNQIGDNASTSEKINAIVRQLKSEQITRLVEKAFPNLKFRCYAGIKGEKDNGEFQDVTDKDIMDSEFIILDEAHRLGASEWGPRFESNLRKNAKAKVLAITATPERVEKDLKELLDRAFEIFETSSPCAFDEPANHKEKSVKGLNSYYFSNSNSSEKRERLDEFFEICPRARKIVIREVI